MYLQTLSLAETKAGRRGPVTSEASEVFVFVARRGKGLLALERQGFTVVVWGLRGLGV